MLLCGFAVVDNNTRESGFGEFSPAIQLQRVSELEYSFALLGERYLIHLQGVNTAVHWARQASGFLPPEVLLVAKLAALGTEQLKVLLFG